MSYIFQSSRILYYSTKFHHDIFILVMSYREKLVCYQCGIVRSILLINETTASNFNVVRLLARVFSRFFQPIPIPVDSKNSSCFFILSIVVLYILHLRTFIGVEQVGSFVLRIVGLDAFRLSSKFSYVLRYFHLYIILHSFRLLYVDVR